MTLDGLCFNVTFVNFYSYQHSKTSLGVLLGEVFVEAVIHEETILKSQIESSTVNIRQRVKSQHSPTLFG